MGRDWNIFLLAWLQVAQRDIFLCNATLRFFDAEKNYVLAVAVHPLCVFSKNVDNLRNSAKSFKISITVTIIIIISA